MLAKNVRWKLDILVPAVRISSSFTAVQLASRLCLCHDDATLIDIALLLELFESTNDIHR